MRGERGRHDACGRPRPPAPQTELSCCNRNSGNGFTNETKIGRTTETHFEAIRIARVVLRNPSPKNALLPAFGRSVARAAARTDVALAVHMGTYLHVRVSGRGRLPPQWRRRRRLPATTMARGGALGRAARNEGGREESRPPKLTPLVLHLILKMIPL